MELKTEELDRLVVAHLSHNAKGRKEQEALRGLLLGGDFRAAAQRLHEVCPALAENQWLIFQLKKHQFIHLASLAAAPVDAGGEEQAQAQGHLQEALELARRELAPLALHAYCEAYSDFKACMLALVSGSSANSGAGGSSGGGGDRSAELAEFAGMVVRAVREEVGCGGTQLAQLARYLLLLHQHQHHTGFHPFWWPNFSAQTQRLCGQLLLPQRDALPPAALEPADGGRRLPAGGVREHDVQALRTSLGCDREEAVALLRRNGGSAFRGLQDALQAAHIDEGLLAELADEYATWRGLEAPSSQDQQQKTGSDSAGQASGAESMHVDGASPPPQQVQQEEFKEQQPRPSKLARKGPAEGGSVLAAAAVEERLELPAELSEQQLRAVTQQLERLLAGGQADQALEQLQAADAAFLPDHPTVAFALHHCRFLHQLAAAPASGGGTAAALAIVRQQLSPLAQQHPELLQTQLKAALALLLPLPAAGGGGGGDGAAALQQQQQQGVTDAVTAVRTALRPRCHIREPRLLALLQNLMSLHTAHFKLQRCQDRFAADLGIPALKAGSGTAAPAPAPTGGAAAAAAMAVEAQQALAAAAAGAAQQQWGAEVPVPRVRGLGSDSGEDEEMGEGGSEEEEQGIDVLEQSIITVCEFTGLPRHTAIELLLAHGGDAASVLAHVFP